jgi:hypothetical protein
MAARFRQNPSPVPIMWRYAFTLLLAAAAAAQARAQAPDPMSTAQCQAAREELDAVLNDATPMRRQELAQARTRAATACLGRADEKGERSGAPQPPRAVPAPSISALPQPNPATERAPSTAPPFPALAIPRPTVITTCDPAGCWDSEGRRLNQLGPNLVGPAGPCIAQGAAVNCP